jgi:hypothetical protein
MIQCYTVWHSLNQARDFILNELSIIIDKQKLFEKHNWACTIVDRILQERVRG